MICNHPDVVFNSEVTLTILPLSDQLSHGGRSLLSADSLRCPNISLNTGCVDFLEPHKGPNEDALAEAATQMLDAFRLLVHHIMESGHKDDSATGGASMTELVGAWDTAWLNYLSSFVMWKQKDAAALEAEVGTEQGGGGEGGGLVCAMSAWTAI